MSGGSWAPDLKPLNTMATVERTSLNDDNPPAVLSIREPNNFDVRFASLRNADLVNMAEAGTSPATALKRGHIRATVRFRKDLKNVNKDVSFALLLTSSTPKKHSTLFSSQDNTQSHKSKRLECIFPGSTKRLPNVGDVIELALNSPTILNSTNMASFPFKLKFDTVIMRIIPTAANDVEVQETSPKAPETTIQGSASTLMNRKEGITSLLKPENSAVPSFQKEAPPPLVPVENSIPLESRVIQPNLRIEPKTHHPDTVPTDASTTKLLQKEPTKKSMSHKGLAKKNRHQLQKTAEDILRRGQKQLQVEPQSRTSHQRRRSQGENTSPSSLLPLNIVNESVPKKKLAKQVVKAFSKSLPSTAILDDEELGPKDMSTKFSQSEVRVDHSSTKLNDDQMANPLTVDMLLEWEEEMTTGDTIEPIDDQIADIDEFYDLPEDTIRDEPMVDASQVEDPDQMVYMVQMGDQDEPIDIPVDDSNEDDESDTFGLGTNGFVSPNGRFSSLRELKTLRKGDRMNLIAMVQGQGEIKLSRGDCWMRSYELFDHSIGPVELIKMNLFFSKKSWVPDLAKDQIILLKDLKVDEFNHRRTLTGWKGGFRWIAHDPESDRQFFSDVPEEDRAGAPIVEPHEREVEYIHSLVQWWRKKNSEQGAYRPAMPFNTKHKLLSEFNMHTPYIDATVELVLKRNNDRYMELGISDYTKNDEFKDFVRRGVPGRQMTLSLYIFPNEDTFGTAKMLTIGKYYKIKNMKVDVFRGQLQAKMGWEGDFIMLTERDADGNPELRRLLERKAAFERQEESIKIETSPVGEVRYGNPKYSLEAHTSDDPVSIQGSFASQRLVCKSTAPLRTFAQLYSTVHPVESRIRARVIEFLPRDHQDMVTAHCKRCQSYQRGKDIQQLQCPSCQCPRTYELQFAMLMADEDDNYVPVKVAGDEGLKLFGFETVDFEKELLDSVSIVEQVEAKLSTIIGNLWKLMEARHPLFQTGQFDATALARLVESPWVDIGIRSWFLRDEEGLWTQQYGLFHCSFE